MEGLRPMQFCNYSSTVSEEIELSACQSMNVTRVYMIRRLQDLNSSFAFGLLDRPLPQTAMLYQLS